MELQRDYGTIGGAGYSGTSLDTQKYSQVYQATHEGQNRLPYMNRSFISFSYGGKWIEDFNLIATVNGDRMERDGYSSFNDLTTTYDNLDGQQYWGTHYKNNTFNFRLATDGIDQQMLDNFLNWFIAGQSKELILAEHPNRAQMARVAEPPQLSLLPFEHKTSITISANTYSVTTTLYKGEINLKLVMDEPHWYAIDNILGIKNEETSRYEDKWKIDPEGPDEESNYMWLFNSPDALKILYEDGIPLGSMIGNNMLLGNHTYAEVESNSSTLIWSIPEADIIWENGEPTNGEGARIHGTVNGVSYVGQIYGAVIRVNDNGISTLEKNQTAYFFYAGTAPSTTIVQFTITPRITNRYIDTPANNFSNPNKPYNTMKIGSLTEQELRFTTPNIYTSYNNVIKIFEDTINDTTKSNEDIRDMIRERIRHQYVRQWAIKVIDYGEAHTGDRTIEKLSTYMSYFLQDNASHYYDLTCEFNSKTGSAIGTTRYRKVSNTLPNSDSDWQNYGVIPDIAATNNFITEDIGDMLYSNYLIIRERNRATQDGGRIIKWEENHPEYSHYIKHDFPVALQNISIIYKNMYL